MDMEPEGTSNFLKTFKPLIHKVLNQLNIRQSHMNYEDYYQELQIKLIDILKFFKNDSLDLDEKNCKFVAYAKQGLYWEGLDLLRKDNRRPKKASGSRPIEWLEDRKAVNFDSFDLNLYTEDFFRLAKKRLSSKDFLLLLQLADGQYTMQELADEYGVVRDTIYQWKNRIQERLEDIKDCLKD